MKNKSLWSILLFVGMFLVAGVGFISCEKNNGPSGGGSSDSGSGGGSSVVNDSLPHCWQLIGRIDTTYEWATLKEIQQMDSMMKAEGRALLSYKLSTAKTEGECDAMNIDPDEKQCWELTYTYKGENRPFEIEYVWATLKEIQKWGKEDLKEGVTMTYRQYYADDEYACNELNGPGKEVDPDEKHCWELTFTYKGESHPYKHQYSWLSLNEIQEWEKNAAESGTIITYTRYYARDEYACEEMNGPETLVEIVCIKHPWGTGEDEDWSWEWMNYNTIDNYHFYIGAWGGVGAYISIGEPNDYNSRWYSEDDIDGAYNFSVGDTVKFIYKYEQLSVSPLN